MELFVTPAAMRSWSFGRRCAGARIGVVPTMGALHEGHLSLVHAARDHADEVVVTIFVNPLQFDRTADLAAYPRPIEADVEFCRAAGVAAVYAPTADAMYPAGFETHVEPGPLADRLEGPMRPGHFRGVTTVVTKLLGATVPDVAVFGRKDYQQLAIVERMVADLDLGIRIVSVPTSRESDGVARSSRNTRLTAVQRRAAPVLWHALRLARDAWRTGTRDADRLRAIVTTAVEAEPEAQLEYVEVVDARSLVAVDRPDGDTVVLVAAWFGEVRLIDNLELPWDGDPAAPSPGPAE